MKLAPIIIFNYNRPDHSLRTWDALSQNEYAAQSELYLYCDGPKERLAGYDVYVSKINETQSLAEQYAVDAVKEGKFKAVHVVCAKQNKGLANSIIGGVTEVINKHGRVIVLEDDLLTSPYFIKYMNGALDYYENRSSVFSIGAHNFPSHKMRIPTDYEYDTYVSLRFNSWGWAMWKDRWDKIDWSMDYIDEFVRHPEQINAFNRGGDDLTEMLLMQRDHKIDSWAIRCAYNQYANHYVTIMPCKSYVDNIGLDGSGVHCANIQGAEESIILKEAPANPHFVNILYEDSRIVNAYYNYYCRIKRPLWQRVINTIYRKMGKPVPFVIKKKIYA